jgi:LacI family transcriptional regulator
MRVTISDVSRAAGVSVKTVSRVLNNERYVSTDTRERVEKAISELRFRPSLAARSLAGRRSFQVALICDNPSPYFVYSVQAGVKERCAEENVRMIAQPYSMGSDTLVEEIESLLDQTSPDGLILTPPVTDFAPVLTMLRAREIPFVRISPGSDLMASSSVFIDNRAAAKDMTSRLIEMGHRRIGFIVGHPGYAASGQRLTGYLEALQDAGLLATAHRLGLSVPHALSIAGFDDTDLAKSVWPPLSTIRQPVREMAYEAADLLFRGGTEVERRQLPFDLVLRGSTAPAARASGSADQQKSSAD